MVRRERKRVGEGEAVRVTRLLALVALVALVTGAFLRQQSLRGGHGVQPARPHGALLRPDLGRVADAKFLHDRVGRDGGSPPSQELRHDQH